MRFESYLINEGILDFAIRRLKNLKANAAKRLFKDSWIKFVKMIKSKGLEKDVLDILNKYTGKKYKSLDKITTSKLQESAELSEDFAHWWRKVRDEAFPTLAFYPALTVWLEIDKLIGGSDADLKKIGIYAMFWLLLISGKYVAEWMKWKKEQPTEREKEQKERKQKKGFEKIKYTFRSV